MFYFGYRYAYSFIGMEFDDIKIYDHFMEEYETLGNPVINDLHARWMEFLAGMKAELFFLDHLYIGMALKARVLLSVNKGDAYPYIVSGYGRGDKSVTVDVQYSLTYKIPLNRKYLKE
jgi:hypothetical protein